MGSFKADLFIDGQQRRLLFVDQSIEKYFDITGKPNGKKAVGSELVLAFESTGNDSFFYHNMFSSHSMVNGEVVFYKRDGFGTFYKMEFANAYILGLQEEFDHNNDMPLYLTLRIGWGVMKLRGSTIEEYWNPNNPWEEVEETKLEEKEPSFLGYFFEDEEGKPIKKEKLKHNQTFYLIIKSESADGETISINLDDDRLDFKYDGKIAKNDILRGVPLTGDETRVELIAVKQKQQQNG